MFDTGTNLFGYLLMNNIGEDVMSSACPGMHDDVNWNWYGFKCWAWKHAHPDTLKTVVDEDDDLIVALVRSPIAHIAGWLKAPYDLSASCASSAELVSQD